MEKNPHPNRRDAGPPGRGLTRVKVQGTNPRILASTSASTSRVNA